MADPFAKKFAFHLSELERDDELGKGLGSGVSSAYVSHLSRTANRHSASPAGRPHSRSPLPALTRHPLLPFPALSLAGAPGIVSGPPGLGHPRREVELKQKIQALEDTVAEYERQKFNVMGTFAEYRERVTERERKLEAEYSAKIISLSDEVLAAKKDFEDRMKQFQALQEKFEREKETAMQKLREQHQKEIQLMEQRCSESQLLNLEQKYMYEIQRLEEERKSLRSEKERLGDAFDSKLRRAQNLYETELHASKALYSKELEALKEHEEALKDELMARQDEFRDRLEDVQEQFAFSKDELVRCKAEVAQLQIRLQQKEREVKEISEDLRAARLVSEESVAKLSTVESELEDTRKQHREQEKDLHQKCKMLAMLETARDKLELVLADLQVEVRSLRNKVAFLENERANLESQSESQSQLQNSQVQALEAVMENLTKEKEATKDHFEVMMEQERLAAEEREFGLKKDFASKLREACRQQEAMAESVEGRAVEERAELREKVVREYEARLDEATAESEQLEDEVQRLRSKLHSLLSSSAHSAGPGGGALRKELEVREEELKAAKAQITSLIKKSGTLTRELEEAKKPGELPDCDFHEHHRDEIDALRRHIRNEFLQAEKPEKEESTIEMEEDVSGALEEVKTQLKNEELKVSTLTDELSEAKSELAKHRDLLSAANRETNEEFAKSVEDRRESKEREVSLQQQVSELERTIEELRSSEASEAEGRLQDAVTALSVDVSALSEQLEAARAELAEKEARLRSFEADAAAADDDQRSRVDQLLAQIDERESEIQDSAYFDELKQQIAEAKADAGRAEELETEIRDLRAELEEKNQQLLALQCEPAAQTNQTPPKELDSAEPREEEVERLRESAAAMAAEMEQLRLAAETEPDARVEELEKKIEEKDKLISRLKKELRGGPELVSTSSSDSSSSFKEAVEKQSHHSDSKRSSISSTSGCSSYTPRETSVHLCKKANLTIVDKWHCLVNTLTHDKAPSKSPGPVSRSGSKTPTNARLRRGEDAEGGGFERSGARSLSRVGSPAESTDGSLSVPDGSSRRSEGKSPTRSTGGKKGPIPIDKRPAWKF